VTTIWRFSWRALGVAALALTSASSLSCNVNEYCIGCAVNGDGGNGDSTDGGDGDAIDAPDGDAPDASDCVPTGPEVCDDKDNDCDNSVDEGSLPTIGEACSSPPAVNSGQGECAGGVKQCTNGTVTCTKAPAPELCDLLDNNCNGLTDEGDPGGGALCGTNTGECTAGVNRCVSGVIDCVGDIGTVGGQMELCNNRDDDCDGMFDEMVATGGPCTTGTDVGLCDRGMLMCLGGIETCVGQIGPTFELCDGFDQDCDGNNTNGYDLDTDVQNCGMCGMVCNLPNSFEGCGIAPAPPGTCMIVACAPNFFDNNGVASDGCEFDCGHPFLGAESCNGIDDDCDGLIDMADPDMVPPTGLCDSDGACSTMTTLFCGPPPNNPTGTITWRCDYANPNVSKDAGGNLIPETRCDSDIVSAVDADNDCDGRVDEAQEPNLGNLCTNGMQGICSSTGTFVCNTTNRDLAAVCNAPAGGTSTAETCDGLDNNCNGIIDDGADLGTLAGQEWVAIPRSTVQIMKYEASRPDALTGNQLETHACSTAGRLPWTNITYDQAEQSCQSISARLCTEAEWQQMCTPSATYPVTGPATAGTTDFVFIEAEDAFANTTIGGASQAWTALAPASFNGVTAMQVPDNGFAATAPNALAQSSRLDYRLDLLGSTNYRVWMRMRAPGATADPFGVHTAPSATDAPVSNAATQVGDLVIVTTWTRGTAGIPTHTLQAGFTQIRTQDLNDGSLDGKLSIAYRVATVAGAQTNRAYITGGGTSYSSLTVLKVGNFDLGNILSNSTSSTGNGAPNPPDAGTLTAPSVVLAIGAWHLAGNTVAVSPPTGYTELGELAGSNVGELSIAAQILGASGNPDPGAFGDNVSPNGTASATIAIALSSGGANDSLWVGLAAGTTAGAANAGDVIVPGVDQWTWVVSPQLTSGAAGVHTFSIYTREDGVIVDTIAVSRQSTSGPTFDNSWAYQNNPRTAQPQVCNGDELDTDGMAGNGDQDAILTAGSLASCFANQAGANDAFDMSGNVKEWTQARTSGANPLRGGASNNVVTGLTCGLNFTLADDQFFFPNAGFRCCK
jgi:formylglycine-generating enzyme required for sulfatase activity